MTETTRPSRWLGVCALAVVVLMAVVVSASAGLRLSQPRPPCADWPTCRLATSPVVRAVSKPDGLLRAPAALDAVRAVHRVAATAALLLAFALVGLARRERPRRAPVWWPAVGVLALALALAALGVVTSGSRAAGVLLGNLLGGFAMAAVAWLLVRQLSAAPPLAPALRRQAGVLCGGWALQAALGALSGAGLLREASALHLLLACVLLPWAGVLGWRVARAGRRRSGLALLVVCGAQLLLGLLAFLQAAAPAAVLVHNAGAALGMAVLLEMALAGAGRSEAARG